MPGLISRKLPNNENVMLAQTSPYDPTLRTVNKPSETVAGQLDTMLGTGSPYIERARAGAAQAANARGLINSSISAGAGEAAAIDAALPIAQQDANIYGTAAQQNQSYQNTAGQFNAGAMNTANLNAAAAGNQSLQATQQGQIQTGLIGAQAGQTRQTQAEAALQALQLSSQQGQIQTGLIGTQAGQARQTQTEAALQAAQLSGQQAQQTQQQIAAQAEQARQTATLQNSLDTALQTLRGQQATDLSNVEAQYRTTIQTSASAAQLFTSITNAMTVAQSDANTTPEQKAKAATTLTNMLKSGLAVIGGASAGSNVDLTTLLTF